MNQNWAFQEIIYYKKWNSLKTEKTHLKTEYIIWKFRQDKIVTLFPLCHEPLQIYTGHFKWMCMSTLCKLHGTELLQRSTSGLGEEVDVWGRCSFFSYISSLMWPFLTFSVSQPLVFRNYICAENKNTCVQFPCCMNHCLVSGGLFPKPFVWLLWTSTRIDRVSGINSPFVVYLKIEVLSRWGFLPISEHFLTSVPMRYICSVWFLNVEPQSF